MVAYSFEERFIQPIKDGLKTQTIRGRRRGRGHARPGELLQLYHGQRGPECFKIIEDPVCTEVLPLQMSWKGKSIDTIRVGQIPLLDLNAFACADGFNDLDDMNRFFEDRSDEDDPFEGAVIGWMPQADIPY